MSLDWILIKAPGDLRELRIEENRIVAGESDDSRRVRHNSASIGFGGSEINFQSGGAVGRWPANFALSHNSDCVAVGEKKVKTSDPRRADGSVNCGLGTMGIYGGVADPDAKMDKPRYCGADGTETVEAWQCSDGCAVKALDEQSGHLHGAGAARKAKRECAAKGLFSLAGDGNRLGDSGTASRFFYVAKPSTRERSAGMPEGARNSHVTVKATALMQHLIHLIAAPGDLVLDPFTGSGTTGIAAVKERCRFVGIEHEVEHVEIAQQRIAFASAHVQSV